MDLRAAPTQRAGQPDFLSGGGEMGALMRAHDWGASPLGPPDRWPQALRTVVRLMLSTNHPMFIFWGAEHICFYNDAYKASIGPEKHPAMLGARGREMWDEIWHIIGPQIDQVMAGEGATWHEDHLVPIIRNGKLEEVYWTYGYSPIDHAGGVGGVGGVLVLCNETTERVLAERRRVAELGRLRELFQQAPSFVTVLTGPTHTFEFVNDAYQRLFLGDRNITGMAIGEAMPEASAQGFVALLDGVYQTGRTYIGRGARFELQSLDGQPREFFVDFIYKAIRDTSGAITGVFCEGYDVTERTRAEEALRQSEASLRALADAMPQLVWAANAAGEIDYFNKRVVEYARSKDPATGRWYVDVHPEDRDATVAAWWNALETGQPYYREHRLCDAKGRWRWHISRAEPSVDETGAVKWHGAATDIHSLKEAEARLRDVAETLEKRFEETLAERKLLADIVESTDAFVQAADCDFRWIAINKAGADEFQRIYGVRPRVGDCMLDLLGDKPQQREAVRSVWARALAGAEFTEIAHFGESEIDRRAYEMKFNVLRDRDGANIGAYQFAYDVTERLADQERLARAQEALRQAQKMEAVGQLTGGVAHDFNNLLMAISGGLRLLDRPGDPERKQLIKEGILRAVERGAGLTRQLLAFSRRRPLEARPLSLGAHIAGMSEMLERSLRGDVHVAMNLPERLWSVEADPGELELAVLNLCVNARDAMPSGGVIEIEAQNVTLSRGPVIGEAVRLTVRDPGEGMDEHTLARVFEPFFTTKEVGKGSGLGLAQVYAFMSQSKGTVEIDSKPGQGTSVSLVFPRTTKSAGGEVAAPAEETLRANGERLRVLLVEDDHDVGAVTAEMLITLGHDAIHVTSPVRALELLEKEGIDLVLSDVMMAGGMSGLELARIIRARRPTLPIILATGFAEAAGGAEEEGFGLLLKPYELTALQRSLAGCHHKH